MLWHAAVLVMKFFFDHFDFTSSGAIAALVQGLLAKELWKRGIPSKLAGKHACSVPHSHSELSSSDALHWTGHIGLLTGPKWACMPTAG